MLKNFLSMPILLKLMTISAFGILGFVVGSLITNSPIMVFGQPVSVSEWWGSGAGPLTVVIAFVGGAAGLLMLTRSSYGRPAYLLTWLLATTSIPVIAILTGKDVMGSLAPAVFDLLVTIALGIYMYRNSSVRRYFVGTS